ncbi:MAG: hypothetical protein WCS20_08820, partial [Alphaproteobacteria bacterium]
MANSDLDAITALSVALTGFTAFHLRGTGLLDTYTKLLAERMGPAAFAALIAAHAEVADIADPAGQKRAMRHKILSDACIGPAARSLLKLWYVGVWHALPAEWHDRFGGALDDVDGVPCAASYTEG